MRTSNNECPYGPQLQKYWDLRYELFSRFDDGVQLDKESLFSAKPELIAIQIASYMPGNRVLDAFCGVGGVAIALARTGKKVTALDIDLDKIKMAEHNAELYGCRDNINFVCDDFFSFVGGVDCHSWFDSCYADPPWGGPDYYKKQKFLLSDFTPDGKQILQCLFACSKVTAISLPLNFDMNEIGAYHKSFNLMMCKLAKRNVFWTAFIRP